MPAMATNGVINWFCLVNTAQVDCVFFFHLVHLAEASGCCNWPWPMNKVFFIFYFEHEEDAAAQCITVTPNNNAAAWSAVPWHNMTNSDDVQHCLQWCQMVHNNAHNGNNEAWCETLLSMIQMPWCKAKCWCKQYDNTEKPWQTCQTMAMTPLAAMPIPTLPHFLTVVCFLFVVVLMASN